MAGRYPTVRQYLSPQHWPTWLAFGSLWCLSRFPFQTQLTIGRGIGLLMSRLIPSRRRVALTNLKLAFPQLDEAEISDLADESFKHVGCSVAELASVWYRPLAFYQANFEYSGLEHIESAQSNGKGVLILQAHFTMLDILGAVVGSKLPLSVVADTPNNALFGTVLKTKRERYVQEAIDNRNIRKMVRRLRNNEIVWYSPDLFVARSSGGILTTYFDVPALTTDGIARIAKLTGATIVPFIPTRGTDGAPSVLTFFEALDPGDLSDTQAVTQRMNNLFEQQVRTQPEQYFWAHKRFKPPGPDYTNPYA